MPVANPRFGEPHVLGGVRDRDGLLVQDRQRRLIVGRDEQPEAMDAAGTSHFVGGS